MTGVTQAFSNGGNSCIQLQSGVPKGANTEFAQGSSQSAADTDITQLQHSLLKRKPNLKGCQNVPTIDRNLPPQPCDYGFLLKTNVFPCLYFIGRCLLLSYPFGPSWSPLST